MHTTKPRPQLHVSLNWEYSLRRTSTHYNQTAKLMHLAGPTQSTCVCSRRDLEYLIGHLNHACKVVRAGRSFLRRMLDLLHSRSDQTHTKATTPIRLNREFRADLAWWRTFIERWNGVSFRPTSKTHPSITVASDASGQWGCGAWWGPIGFRCSGQEQRENCRLQ